MANEELAERLKAEYGEDKPQDLHIDYFYLILGKEILNKKEEIISALKNAGLEWYRLETEWFEFVIIKINLQETERAREELLNERIRLLILKEFPLLPPSAIIISRVCKYTGYVPPKNELTTGEIEYVLANKVDQRHLDQQHLDYFYLTVKARDDAFIQVKPHLEEKLSKLPGEWKAVTLATPQQTWPLTFIGYLPKKPFESERKREWRINMEIRMPLKEHLKTYINYLLEKNNMKKPKKVVIVLFSRACKYTEM